VVIEEAAEGQDPSEERSVREQENMTRGVAQMKASMSTKTEPPGGHRATAVIYARVSSKQQETEGFSIPAQLELLRSMRRRTTSR
jgi:predicted site-specific integrase-resolvase